MLAALAEGTVTVWTKGKNVGYVDEPTEVDLSIYICDVCVRPISEHDAGGPGRHADFPDTRRWAALPAGGRPSLVEPEEPGRGPRWASLALANTCS